MPGGGSKWLCGKIIGRGCTMNKLQKISIFLLRVTLGWLFVYAGVTKVLDSNWSAAGYLESAKTFPGLFHWFANAQNIGWINFVNEWGLTVVGVSLILGIFVRLSSAGGALLMALYYLPVLEFPYIAPHSFLVDEHIIYLLVFILLFAFQAGRAWGLDGFLKRRKS